MKRKIGDWVWLVPNAGFIGDSHRLKAEIIEGDGDKCLLCEDPSCVEWDTLWTELDLEDGKRHMLCHVSECQMLDEPWKPEQNA